MAAIVVGGSTGIGLAVARRLACRGYLLGVCARTKDTLDNAVTEVIAERAKAWGTEETDQWPPIFAIQLDAGAKASVQEAIAIVNAQSHNYGTFAGVPTPKLTAAVNCAGIAGDGLLMRQTETSCMETLAASLHSSMWLVQEAAKGGMIRYRNGSIVLTSSIAAASPREGQAAYAAAKAGIEGLVRASSVELGRFGVRVNGIAPGFVDTQMTASSLSDADKEAVRKRIPLGRIGSVDEIASAIDFLLSPHAPAFTPQHMSNSVSSSMDLGASYVSGQTLIVDGGLSVSGTS